MISHVNVLSSFHHRPILPDQSQQSSFIFGTNCTCIIGHVVLLSCFHHRQHLVLSITIVQYHFWGRLHPYYWSRHCSVSFFIDRTLLDQSQLYSFIFSIDYTYTIGQVVVMSGSRHRHADLIGHDSSLSFLMVSHVIVLFHFHHRPHLDRIVLFFA